MSTPRCPLPRVAVAGVALVTALCWPPSRAARACDTPAHLSLDCTQEFNCCVDGQVQPDVGLTAPFLCADPLLFSLLADQCSPSTFNGHNNLFNVVEQTYAEHGLNECTPVLEHPKHWMGAFLIGTSIRWEPGKTWHHPILDYLTLAVARNNHLHAQFEHQLAITQSTKDPAASYGADPFFPDTIRFFCPAFMSDIRGSAVGRAGIFVHESWHAVYGSHALIVDDPQASFDFYLPHDHVLREGEVGKCFDPDPAPKGWQPNFFQCATQPSLAMTSVYQIEYEFFCDLNDSPEDWVPRTLARQGGLVANYMGTLRNKLLDDVFIGATGVFLNTPPITCTEQPPMRDGRGPSIPGRPRFLHLRLAGNLFEGSEGGLDDDELFVEKSFDLELTSDLPAATIHWVSPSVDDVHVEFKMDAALQPDGETVNVRYNVFFFDDDTDGTDCDSDLTGYDCPGLADGSNWPEFSLSSGAFILPPVRVILDNVANENGNDFADLLLFRELDW